MLYVLEEIRKEWIVSGKSQSTSVRAFEVVACFQIDYFAIYCRRFLRVNLPQQLIKKTETSNGANVQKSLFLRFGIIKDFLFSSTAHCIK